MLLLSMFGDQDSELHEHVTADLGSQ